MTSHGATKISPFPCSLKLKIWPCIMKLIPIRNWKFWLLRRCLPVKPRKRVNLGLPPPPSQNTYIHFLFVFTHPLYFAKCRDGCFSLLSLFCNLVELERLLFESLDGMFPTVIWVDDARVFWIQRETVRYSKRQTVGSRRWNTSQWAFFFRLCACFLSAISCWTSLCRLTTSHLLSDGFLKCF